MNRHNGMWLVCAAFSIGLVLSAFGASVMPFLDTFDGPPAYTNLQPLDATNNWGSSQNTSGAKAFAQAGLGYNSSTGMAIPSAVVVSNLFDTGAAYERVWTTLRVKPVFQEVGSPAPTVDGSALAMFYVTSNGYVAVGSLSGNVTNWTELKTSVSGAPVTPLQEGSWVHLAVFSTTNKWSLFVNDLLLAENMNAISPQSFYEKFQVQNRLTAGDMPVDLLGASTCYVDNVFITTNPPPATPGDPLSLLADSDGDGMRDCWELFYFGTTLSTNTASADPDSDGLSNGQESWANTDPLSFTSFAEDALFPLPYCEPFDSLLSGAVHGQHGWRGGGSSAQVQSSVKYAGAKALSIGNVEVVMTNILAASPNIYTNVWTDMVVRPGFTEPAAVTGVTLSAQTTVAFFLDTNGYVNALDGGNWRVLTNFLAVSNSVIVTNYSSLVKVDSTNDWTRMIIQSDYSNDKWNLYLIKSPAASNAFAKLIGWQLGFTNAATAYTGLVLTNMNSDANYYLDELCITLIRPKVVDSDDDGVPDNFEEENLGMDPYTPAVDENNNGIPDVQEYNWGTTNLGEIVEVGPVTDSDNTLRLEFEVGKDRTYTLYGLTSPTGGVVLTHQFYTGAQGASNTYDHVDAASTYSRLFYKLVGTEPILSGTETTTVLNAWYKKPLAGDNQSFVISVPVDYPAGENTLGGELGKDLARALGRGGLTVGDEVHIYSNGTWVAAYLSSTTNWIYISGGSGSADGVQVNRGQGVVIRRRSATNRPRDNALFIGLSRTGTVYQINVNSNWNLIAWPHHDDLAESANASVPADAGWGFGGDGGHASANPIGSGSDKLWLFDGTNWTRYGLLTGSGYTNRWWRTTGSGGVAGSVPMRSTEALFYQNVGAPFTWNATSP